jgi:hypothetical protein
MDQLKTHLAALAKHGFWIGTTLILIGSLAIWYLSTSSLAEETESESSKLSGKVGQISRVSSSMATVPNELSHEVMRKMVKDRQDEVLESWQTLFDRQKPYLTWPVEDLGEDFVEKFRGKIPIEQYISFPPEPSENLSRQYLQRYKDHIQDQPKLLAKIANAEWTEEQKGRSSGGGLSGLSQGNDDAEAIEEIPVVAWSDSSQKDLLNDLFPWGNGIPSTLQIYYSQESQWILKQLMTIIKEVNGDATQPYQAKIREIETINIGRSVNFNVGDITSITGGSSLGGMGGGGLSPISQGASGAGSSLSAAFGGGGSGGTSAATVDPADGRYVDKNLNQITASDLRSALTSNKPADASLAVAKRVPIMMGLKMDQRAVQELLAACGSADLMVEVTHVRVLDESSASSSGSRSSGPSSGGGGGLSALGGSSSSSRSATKSEVDEYPFDVSVELYGMIYVYNPPDPNKLPVEQVTKETVDEALGETPVAEEPRAEAAAEGPLEQTNEELQPPAAVPADESETPAAGAAAVPEPADAVPATDDGRTPEPTNGALPEAGGGQQ